MPRKLAERMAHGHEKDARAYLAAIVDSSEDAILSKDLNGIITSCNAAAERIFGYTADELIGQSVLKLIPRERHEEEAVILARVRAGERVDHFETVRMRKDGRRIDISLTVSAVRDDAGVIVGASKIARDITERKRASAALAAQEAWFRITLNSIGDAVIAIGSARRGDLPQLRRGVADRAGARPTPSVSRSRSSSASSTSGRDWWRRTRSNRVLRTGGPAMMERPYRAGGP